jgi:hypothetical protein
MLAICMLAPSTQDLLKGCSISRKFCGCLSDSAGGGRHEWARHASQLNDRHVRSESETRRPKGPAIDYNW